MSDAARMQGAPQADSPGLGNLRLLLRKGERTVATIVVPPNGHFEEDNIVPGDYDLIVDADTVPANYSAGADSVPIHIAPVSTVETNLPLRAMRSIAGHVFLKVPINGKDHAKEGSEKFTLLPLVGVRLAAGGAVATTGDGGAFVLRNLPAGDLSVTFVPLKVVPEDLKLPTGKVQMPAEPIEIEGSKIVLSNPELVPYLVPAENRK